MKFLDYYSSKKISFPSLVSKLDMIFTNLDGIPSEKLNRLKDIWWDLEEINAVVLDESSKDSISDFKEDISRQLEELRVILKDLKEDGF